MTRLGVQRLAAAWSEAQTAYERGNITPEQWKSVQAVHRLPDKHASPEALWQLVLSVLEMKPSEVVKEILAAGPLEDLIREFGPQMLEPITARASQDPDFSDLLKKVWVQRSPDPVIQRYIALGCSEVVV